MNNETYLFKLQQEYLSDCRDYMDSISAGKRISELKEKTCNLRSLIAEIKAVKEEIARQKIQTSPGSPNFTKGAELALCAT